MGILRWLFIEIPAYIAIKLAFDWNPLFPC